jgi:type VI secretion system protein ImpF
LAKYTMDRVAAPLMYAFRTAHEKRDAKQKLDLRDQSGDRIIAARRVSARAPISEPGLRQEVLRDLGDLFNTTNLAAAEDLSGADAVRGSILNYGFPDLSWRSLEENRLSELSREIETALFHFEPRLERGSIRVRRDVSAREDELKIRYLIKADLLIRPVNVPVEFVAEVELDSGKIKIDAARAS